MTSAARQLRQLGPYGLLSLWALVFVAAGGLFALLGQFAKKLAFDHFTHKPEPIERALTALARQLCAQDQRRRLDEYVARSTEPDEKRTAAERIILAASAAAVAVRLTKPASRAAHRFALTYESKAGVVNPVAAGLLAMVHGGPTGALGLPATAAVVMAVGMAPAVLRRVALALGRREPWRELRSITFGARGAVAVAGLASPVIETALVAPVACGLMLAVLSSATAAMASRLESRVWLPTGEVDRLGELSNAGELQRVAQLGRRLGRLRLHPEQLGKVLAIVADAQIGLGNLAAAKRALTRGVRLAPRHGMQNRRLQLIEAQMLLAGGHAQQTLEIAEHVLKLARRRRDGPGVAHAFNVAAVAMHALERPRGEVAARRAWRRYRWLGLIREESLSRITLGMYAESRGDPRRVVRLLNPAVVAFERLGMTLAHAVALYNRGECRFLTECSHDAAADIRRALGLFEKVGSPYARDAAALLARVSRTAT